MEHDVKNTQSSQSQQGGENQRMPQDISQKKTPAQDSGSQQNQGQNSTQDKREKAS